MATTILTAAGEVPPRMAHADDLVAFERRIYGDWRDEFHKSGCVVIKGVISPEWAEYYREKQLEWLKKFELGFDEHYESTWTADHLTVSFKGGVYFAYGAIHEKFFREARTEPGVIDVFSNSWESNKLITALDGFNVTFPRRNDVKWTPWPHLDQSLKRKGSIHQYASSSGFVELCPKWTERWGTVFDARFLKEALDLRKKFWENYLGTTYRPYRNILVKREKSMRDGEVCPKHREEPFEKPVVTEQVLKLVGVQAY